MLRVSLLPSEAIVFREKQQIVLNAFGLVWSRTQGEIENCEEEEGEYCSTGLWLSCSLDFLPT